MPDFRDLNSLFNYLEKQIQDSLQRVADEVKEVLRDYITKNWYNRPDYDPEKTLYSRTYEYINSITVSEVKEVSKGHYMVSLYFDTDKIHPYPPDAPGRWSRHQSITTGTDVSVYIPLWIEEGQDSPIYSYPGAHPVGDTKKFLEETAYHVNEIIKILRSKGINVTFQ